MSAAKFQPQTPLGHRSASARLPSPIQAALLHELPTVNVPGSGAVNARQTSNLFVVTSRSSPRAPYLTQLFARCARHLPTPDAWVLVHNVADPRRPRALRLPPGQGQRLQRDLDQAIAHMPVAIAGALRRNAYRMQRHDLVKRFAAYHHRVLGELQRWARTRDVAVQKTEPAIALAPMHDRHAILRGADLHTLSDEERARLWANLDEVKTEAQLVLRTLRAAERRHREELSALERQVAAAAAARVLATLRARYEHLLEVSEHLVQVETDLGVTIDALLRDEGLGNTLAAWQKLDHQNDTLCGLPCPDPVVRALTRYRVNLLVDHGANPVAGAPVVSEPNPTYTNLIGRIEPSLHANAHTTQVTRVRPGALHQAWGGFLLVDAVNLRHHPLAWEALKNVARSKELRLETLGEAMGLRSNTDLAPEPIPMEHTTIVLTGDRPTYDLLASQDPDFATLFALLAHPADTVTLWP